MARKFIIFDWVPEWLKSEILRQIPEDCTVEHLEDLADSLKYELADLHVQLRGVSAKARLEESLDTDEYQDWKERINTRLRVRNVTYGTVLYNLRLLKNDAEEETEKRIKRLENLVNLEYNKRIEKTENLVRHLLEEQGKQHQRNLKRLKYIEEILKDLKPFRSFVYRSLYHLLLRDGYRTDPESEWIAETLSFVPPCLEKNGSYGNLPTPQTRAVETEIQQN
jgi:hypothetical protein